MRYTNLTLREKKRKEVRNLKREKLKKFREKLNLTQEKMALTLGITVAHYKSIEYGYRNPSFELLKKIKEIFPTINIDKIFLS